MCTTWGVCTVVVSIRWILMLLNFHNCPCLGFHLYSQFWSSWLCCVQSILHTARIKIPQDPGLMEGSYLVHLRHSQTPSGSRGLNLLMKPLEGEQVLGKGWVLDNRLGKARKGEPQIPGTSSKMQRSLVMVCWLPLDRFWRQPTQAFKQQWKPFFQKKEPAFQVQSHQWSWKEMKGPS